ncbi:MAG: hypothetical protein HYR96_14645 [Deltaproteobacteria bacterium]|nr:hypothetical protein [Deltaproteobacteria bacterium]MBI3294843.1 hypothetical protein [Deltaproteobacteria bacterium]
MKHFTRITLAFLFFVAESFPVELPCSVQTLLAGGQFYSLDPIFERLGIRRECMTVSRLPVLVDPRAGYVRYFATRRYDLGKLTLEVSAFENEMGVFRGDESATPGIQAAQAQIEEAGGFIARQEARRNWTPEFYARLEALRFPFAGSTTYAVVRDRRSHAIVASLKFIRAPFGGRTYIDLRGPAPRVEEAYGAWGPIYKALAAPSLPLMTADDEMLYRASLPMRQFSNHVLVPRMAWETYAPPEALLDRTELRGAPYRMEQSADGKQFVFYWQHELIEPSGFAIDSDYAERNNAFTTIVAVALAQLLDPSYSAATNTLDRTYVFPNDLPGTRLYSRFGFRPASAPFSLFGMNDWVRLQASGRDFAAALTAILKSKDREATNREIRELVKALLHR